MSQCCSPLENGDGGWGVFNSLFGWQNSATYGSVISYNLYWLTVIVGFLLIMYQEKNGHWPLQKPKNQAQEVGSDASSSQNGTEVGKKETGVMSSDVREVRG